MEIEIIQKKFTFFKDKFEIYIDKVLTYSAESVFSFTSKIKILNLNKTEIGLIKRMNFTSYGNPEYELSFGTNSFVRLVSESYKHYKLHVAKGTIDICAQKGRKLGLFLNDNQIGLIDKNKKVLFGGDKYYILIDSREIEKELIIAFTLAYDDFYNNNKDSAIEYDFGNILINPDKTVDPNWKPKE